MQHGIINPDGTFETHHPLFRNLDAEEVKDFKRWARTNYKPGEPINNTWHPVIQDECEQMNTAICNADH